MSQLKIAILAAGQGKRMHSRIPKVLHRLAGKALLEHVINTAQEFDNYPIVIYGHEGNVVQEALAQIPVTWVKQAEQLGTGHALLQALPFIENQEQVLVLYGDVPLISKETLHKLIDSTPKNAVGIVTAIVANPTGLGRIIRDSANHITRIVEEKDATVAERALQEINSGIYLIPVALLTKWLPHLKNHNAQQEYYLTDIITRAVEDKISIYSVQPGSYEEVLGINDRAQLALLERYYQRCYAEKLLHQGVTLLDPARLDIRGQLTIGKDVTIDVNVIIEGNVHIGDNCVIGANVILRNTFLSDNVEVRANSLVDGAEVSSHCTIGPFARIRPGTILSSHAHVGNFVEVKNSIIGDNTKVNHLSYVGDSDIGKQVNIGAGTITCNYDGINKHRTVIGDNAFIGSNSQLVAPVTIGEGATIGAGSTITRNAPPYKLTLCRAQQRTIENWQRPEKTEKKE